MGYRSEVAFCIQVKEPEKFVALLKLKTDETIKEMMQYMYLDQDFILFYHNYWKWYEESQKALDEILEMAGNYDEDYAAKYARFGEESDDIVEDAWGDCGWDFDFPYVKRSIELGFNPNTAKKLIEEEENATTE